MRLIVLSGHERPISSLKFNRDDDLLFSASSDKTICLWNPENGERLGTYEGHSGAVSDIDVDYFSKHLLSCSADGCVKIWNIETGAELESYRTSKSRLTSVEWACGDHLFLTSSAQSFGEEAAVYLYSNPLEKEEKTESRIEIENISKIKNFKISKAVWSPLNDQIFALCSDGTIRILNVEKLVQTKTVIFDNDFDAKKAKFDELMPDLTDFQYCSHLCAAIITSRNAEAKMFDIDKWNVVKTYGTDRSLNTVAIHPKLETFACGGGKEAQQAALDKSAGKYEILFYHSIYEEKMGTIVTDCYSPINSMKFNSEGNLLVIGYEEGTARMFQMGSDFDEKFKKMEKRFISENVEDENYS